MPPAVINERPNQPDQQSDSHAETGKYAQAVQHISPHFDDLRGMVLAEATIRIAHIERRIARDFGMRVQKAR